jgi:hypothetical protein
MTDGAFGSIAQLTLISKCIEDTPATEFATDLRGARPREKGRGMSSAPYARVFYNSGVLLQIRSLLDWCS